jgi:choline dehydrogenase-like flavoprotein
MSSEPYDVIVVGSGAGGAAAAYRVAKAGARVLMLEKGHQLPRDGSTLDTKQVFKEGKYKNKEPWLDGHGGHLVPDEHYNVGGKTKWYGTALLRFSAHEFSKPIRIISALPGRLASRSSSPTTMRRSACFTSTASPTSRSCRC